jgi:2-C-methyl-D-erythritol 4-phosphate cytidylyltransferase
MFRYKLLRERPGGRDATRIRLPMTPVRLKPSDSPKLVEGHPRNLKVTLPDDIRIAELYLAVSQPEFV